MARDVEFAVTASDKTGTALAAAEAKFKATQDRINVASDKIGDGMKRAADTGSNAVGKLRKELDLAESDLKNLAAAWANAGSAAEKMDVAKKLRAQRTEVSRLKGALKDLEGDAVEIGTTAGRSLALTVGATGAPLIGALLSAGIIGGAGLGGIVGGALLAAKDPRVKAAGTQLTENLLGQLQADAAPFVDPLLDQIAKVEVRFGQMNGRIKNIFANSSGLLDPLVDGLLNGVDGVVRGVDALVAKAGPVIEGIATTFDRVGNATGDAFEIIAGGSDEAAQALDDVSRALEFTVISSGYAIRALTEVYGWITFLPRKIGELERSMLGWEEETTAAATATTALSGVQRILSVYVQTAGEAAGDAGLHMATYADKMDDAASKGRGLYDSQTQVADAVSKAKHAIDDNGKTLDLNSEKGRQNRGALSDLAGALTSNYQAYVKVNGEGAAAGRVAEQNRGQFIKLATQFGLSKKQAQDLATQMGLLPANKTTTFHANTHDAEARAKALAAKLDAAARTRTADVNVIINTGRLSNIEQRLNRLGGSLFNAAGASWAASDGGSGTARTGGPSPVNVNSNVNVSLDGQPFYAVSVRAASARSARDAWRQRVGRV